MTDTNSLAKAFEQFDEVVGNILKTLDQNAPKMKIDPPRNPKPQVKPLIPTR